MVPGLQVTGCTLTTPATEPPVSFVPWLHTLQSATVLAPEQPAAPDLQWVVTTFPVDGPVQVCPVFDSVTLPASMLPASCQMQAPVTGSVIPGWPPHVPVCSGVHEPPEVGWLVSPVVLTVT